MAISRRQSTCLVAGCLTPVILLGAVASLLYVFQKRIVHYAWDTITTDAELQDNGTSFTLTDTGTLPVSNIVVTIQATLISNPRIVDTFTARCARLKPGQSVKLPASQFTRRDGKSLERAKWKLDRYNAAFNLPHGSGSFGSTL
jgi:hypothetical protein